MPLSALLLRFKIEKKSIQSDAGIRDVFCAKIREILPKIDDTIILLCTKLMRK